MAFNIGAAIGGFADEYAASVEKKNDRINRLVDEAMREHKNQFQKRRDKEEAKAEVYEGVIKEIAALPGVESVDHAAAIYNKLGTAENATDWIAGAKTITAYGSDLAEMGYIGSMPEDFEASGMTAAEYAKSFTKTVRFGEGISEADKGLSGKLSRRFEMLDAKGLAPADYAPVAAKYAEVTVDGSLRGSQISIEASREMLTTQLSRLDEDSPQYEAVQNSLTKLREAEMIGKGGEIDTKLQKDARTLFGNLISGAAQLSGRDDTGMDIATDSYGNKTYTVNNAKQFGAWATSIIPSILEEQKKVLPPDQYRALEFHVNTLKAINEADETLDEIPGSAKAVPKVVKQADTNLLKTQILADMAAGISYDDAKAEAIADGVDEALFDQIYAETQGQGALVGAGQ